MKKALCTAIYVKANSIAISSKFHSVKENGFRPSYCYRGRIATEMYSFNTH